MFSIPRYVFKDGNVVVEDFEVRNAVQGRTLATSRDYDDAQAQQIESWFSKEYSIATESYGIGKDEIDRVTSGQ